MRYTKDMNVLVVEDEPAIREAEVAFLRRAGFETREAGDGEMAWQTFNDSPVDVVLIDINLPRLSGLELCRRIRAQSMVPIVIITAKTGDDDELHGLNSGADDYVKKPFNPDVLVARVQALLRRRPNGTVRFGDVSLDPTSMRVQKAGHDVSLTTTQFNLLHALASQPGVVLSREQLIDHAYSDPLEHDIYDRTIDAHIKNLRRAIEDDPARPRYIQTVIGRGYRLSGDTQ